MSSINRRAFLSRTAAAATMTGGCFTAAARADDTRRLFSVYSDFGTTPAGGFPTTDQALFHSIAYSSDLDSVEINWRDSWIRPNYRLSGSRLIGFRYVKLDEAFQFFTQVDPMRGVTESDYQVRTDNDLLGAQIGGEFTMCLLPSVIIGGEVKAGLFGNRAGQNKPDAAGA